MIETINQLNVVKGSAKAESKVEQTAYEQLTTLQKQRADYLKPMVGDHGVAIVANLDKRGPNSWPVIHGKVSSIHKATYEVQRYQDALIENFEIDTPYPPADVIGIVSQVRSDLGLEPYLVNPKRNCETDLANLFIVREINEIEVVDGKEKKRLIGLKPVVCLKPEVE